MVEYFSNYFFGVFVFFNGKECVSYGFVSVRFLFGGVDSGVNFFGFGNVFFGCLVMDEGVGDIGSYFYMIWLYYGEYRFGFDNLMVCNYGFEKSLE